MFALGQSFFCLFQPVFTGFVHGGTNIVADDIALQQLYDYDLYLFNLADTVKESVDKVEDAVAANDGIDTAIKDLNKVAEECITALNRRKEVKLGTQNL